MTGCVGWSQSAVTGKCANCRKPKEAHSVGPYEVTDDDSETVERIRQLMSGKEWDADTLDAIGQIMEAGGYKLEDYDPDPDPAADEVRECEGCYHDSLPGSRFCAKCG